MGLKANICRVCGGALKNCGTYYKCVCCDTEYRIDDSMTKAEVEAYFDRLNDFADAERNLSVAPPRFDEAESEFSLIVQKYPDWSAGYWGLVRAKFGIKFERDLSGKAVPSCYKSTYEDFRNTDEYKKAIALAETPELRQSYEGWADYIARDTKEWREEAQKYDYDVFICFKASNDLDGSETRDAREMHKLYDLLKDKGYRVFFSPVTLITDGVVGKGSGPYIFNALDKAKALIVYGSRKEYFSSTWVQNEWQRYLRAIKAGKKEKDSLIVLYEGFNPKELPQGLRRIQGIEYGISAYPAVLSALKRIYDKGDNVNSAAELCKMKEDDEQQHRGKFKAKEMQQAFAQDNSGICYDNGRGVAQDYAKAVYWCGKAAEQGDADAQDSLGGCYYNGRGVAQDYAKAVYWYSKAAEQGHAGAQNNLGSCYEYGQGVAQDYAKAVYWYSKAAKQGDADAQYSLGVCYYTGRGVVQDYAKAVYWLGKAAEQGDADAQTNLGICYYNGLGVPKNLVKAKELFQNAAEKGNEIAKMNLKNIFGLK